MGSRTLQRIKVADRQSRLRIGIGEEGQVVLHQRGNGVLFAPKISVYLVVHQANTAM